MFETKDISKSTSNNIWNLDHVPSDCGKWESFKGQAKQERITILFDFLRTMWSSLKYDFQLDINLKGIKDYLLNDTSIVKSSI